MNTYTDPRLLDVASAIQSLPALTFAEKDCEALAEVEAANGTTGSGERLHQRLYRAEENADVASHSQSGGSIAGVPQKGFLDAARAAGWRTRGDSNTKPSVPKTDALSN